MANKEQQIVNPQSTITDAQLLQGQNGAYYLARANHTGTVAPPTAEYLQASNNADQTFGVVSTVEVIDIGTVNNNNEIGLTSNEITFTSTGVYTIFAQPQILHSGTGNNKRADIYIEKWNGSTWSPMDDSNAYATLDPNESAVLPINISEPITDITHKLRVVGYVDDLDLILDYQATTPATPSIILSVTKIGAL